MTILIREDKKWDSLYPPGFPKFLQVSAPSAVYYEGCPEPLDPRDPDHKNPVFTEDLLYSFLNEKVSQLMVRFGDEFQHIFDTLSKMPNIKFLYLLVGIAILIGIIGMIISVQIMGQLSTLLSMWGM